MLMPLMLIILICCRREWAFGFSASSENTYTDHNVCAENKPSCNAAHDSYA